MVKSGKTNINCLHCQIFLGKQVVKAGLPLLSDLNGLEFLKNGKAVYSRK